MSTLCSHFHLYATHPKTLKKKRLPPPHTCTPRGSLCKPRLFTPASLICTWVPEGGALPAAAALAAASPYVHTCGATAERRRERCREWCREWCPCSCICPGSTPVVPLQRGVEPPASHCCSASAHRCPWLLAAISVWLRCRHATALMKGGGCWARRWWWWACGPGW